HLLHAFCTSRKFSFWLSQISTEEDITLLGRRKLSGTAEYVSGLPFPIPVLEDGDASRPLIRAKLVSSARAVVTEPSHMELLRNRGFYGYVPAEDRSTLSGVAEPVSLCGNTDDEDDGSCTESFYQSHSAVPLDPSQTTATVPDSTDDRHLFLSDVEILFLFHGLGCLQIELPRRDDRQTQNVPIPNPLRLWYYLCSCVPLVEPCIHPDQARSDSSHQFCEAELVLLRRYAAYVYYRSRGWIPRPGLAMGGVDFLLYAQGPVWRHAPFAVLVDCGDRQPLLTCADVATHMRVVHSVGKRLILCRVSLPSLEDYRTNPWDAVRKATVVVSTVQSDLR
ncbi:tRNA-splicing endonuclease subunit Sen2, partial [Paragonimus westermani]